MAKKGERDKCYASFVIKADEKLCIKYEKEWIDECRKNENKIIPYTAIPSEKVEELLSSLN